MSQPLALVIDDEPVVLDVLRDETGAELRVLEGAGHNHPDSLKPVIVEELLRVLARV